MTRTLLLVTALALSACADTDQPALDATDVAAVETSNALETVQELYRAAGEGDNDTVARLLGNDVEWIEAEGGPFEDGNPYVGMDGVGGGVFGPLAETYDDFRVTPERFLVDGDRVLAEGRYTGTHRESGEALNAQFAHVFTTAGDRITGYQQYTDTFQWRRLAGTLGQE